MRTLNITFILLLALLIGACYSSVSNDSVPTKIDGFSTSTPPPPLNPEIPPPTSLPTISANNSKEILESFVQENGGCKLPCIMGLTPGMSENTEVNSFMQYFQKNTREAENQINNISIWSYLENDQGGISLRFFENNRSVSIGLGLIVDGSKLNQLLLSGESYQHLEGGAKKQFGDLYFNDLLRQFTLMEILNLYGLPTQILVRPFPDDPGHPSPPAQYTLDFVLVYPEKGFLIQYISERTERGKYFVGCPTKPYSINISAWDPNTPLNLVDAVEYFSNIDGINSQNVSAFKAVENVTSLSIRQFYEIFRNPNSNECIETPKELWP